MPLFSPKPTFVSGVFLGKQCGSSDTVPYRHNVSFRQGFPLPANSLQLNLLKKHLRQNVYVSENAMMLRKQKFLCPPCEKMKKSLTALMSNR